MKYSFVTEEEDIKNGIVDIYNLYLITVANKENTKNGDILLKVRLENH